MPENTHSFAELLAKNLRVGAVIHKHCAFTTPPKDKFLVVVSIQPRLLVLLINSHVNDFYVRKKLDRFHVPVLAEDHTFLNHDSFANCIDSQAAFDYTSVRDDVIQNYNKVFKGWLTDSCLEQVYNAVKDNNLIVRGHQKEIIASIKQQLPHLKA
ncbi:hypothetical protein [Alkalimarinus coralli]|uniref:hypothetical protein n=1 Tax=Alkalimarinus coralli TaxID=2935863 RepID=UPI00202ACEB5|nr:hypothetical protein [Alkalimarinus coralli]